MNEQEEPEAVSLSPDWPASVGYSDDLFERNDDTTLLDLGFVYVDSTCMRGYSSGITWYVDLEAKRAPVWSYMAEGVHSSPTRFGPMLYDDTKRLADLSSRLYRHHTVRQDKRVIPRRDKMGIR